MIIKCKGFALVAFWLSILAVNPALANSCFESGNATIIKKIGECTWKIEVVHKKDDPWIQLNPNDLLKLNTELFGYRWLSNDEFSAKAKRSGGKRTFKDFTKFTFREVNRDSMFSTKALQQFHKQVITPTNAQLSETSSGEKTSADSSVYFDAFAAFARSGHSYYIGTHYLRLDDSKQLIPVLAAFVPSAAETDNNGKKFRTFVLVFVKLNEVVDRSAGLQQGGVIHGRTQ